ncbi:MAG: hypothetical protein KJ587_12710 [Alphaproteobacteria bacterium]|nr:hypothetical protein [Alphaproteobacteria bacterium]
MGSTMKRIAAAALVALTVLATPAAALDDAQLGALWAELSDGDRAAIRTASGKVGTMMQTVKGSPNARFWGELSGRGLLRNVMLVEIFGQQAAEFEKAGMVAFAVTPKGVESIPGLVKDLEKK